MSDINEIKRIVTESRVHGVYNWNLETIASLITTIESQKEEIERVRQAAKHWQDRYDSTADKLVSQLAITELAVEKFELILQHSALGSASFNVAVSAISEIQRLSR